MRVSSDKADPGYLKFAELQALGLTAHVFLDDAEVPYCSVADEEQGVVVACVLDPDGGPQMDPSKPDRVWVEERRGRVCVELREAA